MTTSLLRDFVKERWVNDLDYDSMSIERSMFKEINLNPRANDLLLSFKAIKSLEKLDRGLYEFVFADVKKKVLDILQ
ncbi:MAG: hypothetical protein DRP87_03275 [Spirochaetes bacterium]|nr:MAG: hypothetical protein DRP87_03275 [Spirochaetota bacterium]